MCRFQFAHVWQYLDGFDFGLRVDEDCFVLRPPRLSQGSSLAVAATVFETHEPTLLSLGSYAKSRFGLDIRREVFPYTNVMFCDLAFFSKPPVRAALSEFLDHPESFNDRWGDLPILGLVASGVFGFGGSVNSDIQAVYFHLSHHAWVRGGVVGV